MKITGRDKRSKVEREIDERIIKLMDSANTAQEVQSVIALLTAKYEMQAIKPRRIKPDTVAVIAANLLGIALILGYEKANVITTKALGFIIRGRV